MGADSAHRADTLLQSPADNSGGFGHPERRAGAESASKPMTNTRWCVGRFEKQRGFGGDEKRISRSMLRQRAASPAKALSGEQAAQQSGPGQPRERGERPVRVSAFRTAAAGIIITVSAAKVKVGGGQLAVELNRAEGTCVVWR